MLTLYQAEWCPYSSAVRERLTELGIDFVARQVEPRREERVGMREATGSDEIPTLVTDEGEVVVGFREIFRFLRGHTGPYERAHRERHAEHRRQRLDDMPRMLIDRLAPLD